MKLGLELLSGMAQPAARCQEHGCPHQVGAGGPLRTAQAHSLPVPGLLPVATAAAAADDTEEAGDHEDAGSHSDGNDCPAGPWAGGAGMELRCPPGQHLTPPGPPSPCTSGESHNSQGSLAMRSGMSPGIAVVPAGAGVLWGPRGCPIFPPCWLGADSRGGWLTSGAGPSAPGPLPHCPAAAGPGSAWARRQPGVARGKGSE